MQLFVQTTKNIPLDILNQIKQFSPWDGLKKQLWNQNPTDTRVKCAWENYAWYCIENWKLISFAVLAQDNNFNKNIAIAMWHNNSTTAVIIYLFTVSEYQKRWNAKKLIDWLFSYAKKEFIWFEKLIRTTSSEYNKNLYIKYWAKLSTTIQPNEFLIQEWIHHDYFFTYTTPMSNQALLDQLSNEWFAFVYERHDEPWTVYEKHCHQDKVSFYVTQWFVTFTFDDWSTKTVQVWERIDVPPGVFHTAIVSPIWCDYVVWQMTEDDA